jgi:hypothetical protein
LISVTDYSLGLVVRIAPPSKLKGEWHRRLIRRTGRLAGTWAFSRNNSMELILLYFLQFVRCMMRQKTF